MCESSQSQTQSASTMNLFKSFLPLLALLVTVGGQAPSADCWYGDMCQYNELDISFPVPATETDQLSKMTWCQQQCFDDASVTCEHFTIHTTRGATTCYLLSACSRSSSDVCLSDPSNPCDSGPKDCTANTNCDMLAAPASDTAIPWQCDDVDPYAQQVPEGKTCFLTCNAWTETATGLPAVITSTCDAGGFTPSVVTNSWTNADVPALPATLPQPDDLAQAECSCAPYDMEWDDAGTMVDYDPNRLLGTDFVCEGGDYLDQTNPLDWKFILTPALTCRLFCDSYHIATMACENGKWTGEPELGAW